MPSTFLQFFRTATLAEMVYHNYYKYTNVYNIDRYFNSYTVMGGAKGDNHIKHKTITVMGGAKGDNYIKHKTNLVMDHSSHVQLARSNKLACNSTR
jgi:hypothetical protein